MIKRLLELIFPPKCVLCRRVLERNMLDLCHECRTKTPVYRCAGRTLRFIEAYTAVWYYEDLVRGSILRYKFHNARSYSGCYGRMIAMRVLQELPQDIDLITWVPIGPKRKAARGYDQGELLARAVSAELNIPAAALLVKRRDNRPQSSIAKEEARRANVLGVYELRNAHSSISGSRILLLDDVITTGATAGECARVLLSAGAKKVYCAAVAAVRNPKQ